ncbi:MAG: calcium-binding protein, partial [Selenomonadaceae bacterium]|nr:calcium-binding protein [Selenomonadaceae bacterium]
MADISNSTSDTLVSGTSGNDSIYNYYWNSQATINSGAGDDEIYNSGTQVSIDAGAGDDFISNGNYGDNVSISGGSGNDSIYNSGTQVTINSGDGHDSIYNWNSQITINSGDGDDSIYNDGSQVTINAGDGDDYIRNFGTQVTINAGDGDDSIFAAGSEQLIQYTNGDGNDTIYGYDETDTIKITDGSSYTTQVSGNDVIVNVGGGSMRLIDVKDKTLNIVNHQAVNDTPTGGNGGTNTQPSVGKSDTPTGSQRTASPTSTTTDALTYNEITNKIKTHNTVTLGSGWSGTIKSSDYDSTVKNVNASNTSSALYIVGNSNANNIIGGSGDNTINSGKGNDTLTGSSGNNIFVYDSGDGNDIITDYSPGEDLIKLNSGTIKKVSVNKNNVVLTVDKQTITLKDAKGKKITVNDSEGNISSQVYGDTNIKISDGDGQTVNASLNPTAVTLDGTSRTTDLNLIANAKANVIYLGAGHTTVTAGRGNDTIT